jgi:hypothetical protein
MTQNKLVAIPGKPPTTVTQAELRAVIDAQNHVEMLAANIRRRLEAGAEFERGTLGASSYGHPSLCEIGIGDAHQCDGFEILDIEPAKDIIRFRDEALREHPKLSAELAAEFATTMWT